MKNIPKKLMPSFLTWQTHFKNHIFSSLNCVRVGKITAFQKDTLTASIQLMQKGIVCSAGGAMKEITYPLLTDCPVFVLSGGKSSVQMPIKAGDYCIVLFSDRMIDDWWDGGKASRPSILRMHDLSDGLALVGIYPSTGLENYTEDGVVIKSNQIKLGEGATKGVARKGDKITITTAQWAAANPVTSQGPVTISKDLEFTITGGSDKVLSE